MILYVNGDSHAAAADAAYPGNWASDDMRYYWMGDLPHPENLAVSWGQRLADHMNYHFHCNALPGSSNDRIIRTTKNFVNQWHDHSDEWLMIIQWSTWDRTEWLIDGKYHQMNASGHGQAPPELQDQHKKFVIELDWTASEIDYHKKIWEFHQWLDERQIRHLFFNGDYAFTSVQEQLDWGKFYLSPYDQDSTYSSWLKKQNISTVNPKRFHYGADAHRAWANFLVDYIEKYQI